MAGTKKLTLAKETLRDLAGGTAVKAGLDPDNDYSWYCSNWLCMSVGVTLGSYLNGCWTDGCTEGTCNSNCGQWSCAADRCGSM